MTLWIQLWPLALVLGVLGLLGSWLLPGAPRNWRRDLWRGLISLPLGSLAAMVLANLAYDAWAPSWSSGVQRGAAVLIGLIAAIGVATHAVFFSLGERLRASLAWLIARWPRSASVSSAWLRSMVSHGRR